MATTKRRDRTPSFRGYTVMMMGAAVPMASPKKIKCDRKKEWTIEEAPQQTKHF